jgi:hypothetical protein
MSNMTSITRVFPIPEGPIIITYRLGNNREPVSNHTRRSNVAAIAEIAVHFLKTSEVSRNFPLYSTNDSIQDFNLRCPFPLVATFVSFKSIWIALRILAPVPAGGAIIGDGESAAVFKRDRIEDLFHHFRDDFVFFFFRVLDEDGVVNLHEDLTVIVSPNR